jgi:hypothetical protein
MEFAKMLNKKVILYALFGVLFLIMGVDAYTSGGSERYCSQVNQNENISFDMNTHRFAYHKDTGETELGSFNETVDDLGNVYYELHYSNLNAYQKVQVFENGTMQPPKGELWKRK